MARHQTHRGLAPQDERHFVARQFPALRAAVGDLCWLVIAERIPQARLPDLSLAYG
jgi:hypothetical protein